jgi:hypothetical protein
LPFQVPGLIVAVTRLTGLDDGGPRRTGALMGQSYTRADLTRVERILAEGKARVARIEQLLGTYRTREGKALLFELHQTLSTMQQHRNQVRRALGLPLSFGDHARR